MCLVLPEEVTNELKEYDKGMWGCSWNEEKWGEEKLVEIEAKQAN